MRRRTKLCDRCRKTFAETLVRDCPNEAVRRLVGKQICYYCCRKCKHHEKHPLCGAIGCTYRKSGERRSE